VRAGKSVSGVFKEVGIQCSECGWAFRRGKTGARRGGILRYTIMKWKNLSFLALAGLVACIVALYLNNSIFGVGPVTITIQVMAALLMVWARLTFGIRSFHGTANPTAGGLVTSGPYRYIRHPIYAAILYFFWAGIAAHLSLVTVAAGLLATALTAVRAVAEEKLLVTMYPEYGEYARGTKRMVPFVL
jgi:protein-S-isoprenylcysteine O-methyltransferase Ste14